MNRRERFGYTDIESLPPGSVTEPGRVAAYLDNEEQKILPYSCALWEYDGDIPKILKRCSQSLRAGAGVKVVLDQFQKLEPTGVYWHFLLDEDHPDYGYLSNRQRKYLTGSELPDGMPSRKIVVQDTMEGGRNCSPSDGHVTCSIEDSWHEFYLAAMRGEYIHLDLSALRPTGTKNKHGLMATGPIGRGFMDAENDCSFLDIYIRLAELIEKGTVKALLKLLGTLNSCILRGGSVKGGIITTSMSWESEAFEDYLDTPLVELPGSHKKSARLHPAVLDHKELCEKIVEKVATESLFLEKITDDDRFFNVCVGIRGFDGFTCLLDRVNLGKFTRHTLDLIPDAFQEATWRLCELHHGWRKDSEWGANTVAPLDKDTQIAVDVMGLANLLAGLKVSYAVFVEMLEKFLCLSHEYLMSVENMKFLDSEQLTALELIQQLDLGYMVSVQEADNYTEAHGFPKLEYIHTVEPAQRHSFATTDISGNTTCRGIWAPFDRVERRVSQTQGNQVYDHGPVQTAAEVGGKTHQKLCELWYRLMARHDRAHGISYDLFMEPTMEWFTDFMKNSPLPTKYYSFHEKLNQNHLRKSVRTISSSKGECVVCAE